MRLAGCTLVLMLVGGAVLGAQVVYDPFAALGSPIPGWSAASGTWTAVRDTQGRTWAQHTGTAFGYLMRRGGAASVGVIEAWIQAGSDVCAGGLVFQWDAARGTGLRAQLSTVGGGNAFGALTLDAPGGHSTLVYLSPAPKTVRLRLVVAAAQARAYADVAPPDGKWDHVLELTGLGAGTSLPYGLEGWQTVRFDDVKFFDAVILEKLPAGGRTIGRSTRLDLEAPGKNVPYVLVASLTPGMVKLPNGWWSPIRPDALTALSLVNSSVFWRFASTLDANGRGAALVNVPNRAALAGVAVYVAGAVLGKTVPPTLLHLFNDVRIDLKV